jgi:glycerate-2-kinase
MCGHANPHATFDVVNRAFQPERTVVKEHLRANSLNERTWEIAAKKAPVRMAKARRAA